jgi:transposase
MLDAAQVPEEVRTAQAVAVVRRVWIQQFYGPDDPPRWRLNEDAPPASVLIKSPYDIEARYSTKRGTEWTGYKVHVTETCDTDTPHLIVNVLTTAATTQDEVVLGQIHHALEQKRLLPAEHLVDTGYTSIANFQDSTKRYGVDVVGPVANDPSWQARSSGGFDHTQFVIDWDNKAATCPAGKASVSWVPVHDPARVSAAYTVRFARADCAACVSREQCTRGKAGRQLTLDTQERYMLMAGARERQQTEAFKAKYALRSGVESLISQGVRVCELRRARYRGQAHTHLQHVITAVALNLLRLAAWLGTSLSTATPISAFSRLAATS